jgi:fructuronate reductase
LAASPAIDYVYQFVARTGRPALRRPLWDELAPTLSPPPELDITAYRAALLARFSNAALAHRTAVRSRWMARRSLPQRLLAPIAQRLARGQEIEALALAVAGWLALARRAHRCGRELSIVDDPLAERRRGFTGSAPRPSAMPALALGSDLSPGIGGEPGLARSVWCASSSC